MHPFLLIRFAQCTKTHPQLNTSTLGKNLIKVPDIKGKAAEGCGKAGDAVDGAVEKGKDIAEDAGKTIEKGGKDAIDGFKNAFGIGRREPSPDPNPDPASPGDLLEDVCNKGAEIAQGAVQLTAELVDKALGSVAKAIGIKEYYSIHIGVLCEGEYKPKFNAPDAEADVKKCTPKFKVAQTDLSKKLDEELQLGPLKFKLSDIGLVDTIQDALDLIPRALAAMAFFFLIAVLSLVLGFLLTSACVALEAIAHKRGSEQIQKLAMMGALGSLGLGWFTSLIGVVAVTIIAHKIKSAVNEHAAKFGMSAATSPGLYVLLWGSLFFSTVAVAILGYVFFMAKRKRAGGSEASSESNYHSGSEMVDNHGYYSESVVGGQQMQPGMQQGYN